jgi:hypothetical protein
LLGDALAVNASARADRSGERGTERMVAVGFGGRGGSGCGKSLGIARGMRGSERVDERRRLGIGVERVPAGGGVGLGRSLGPPPCLNATGPRDAARSRRSAGAKLAEVTIAARLASAAAS